MGGKVEITKEEYVNLLVVKEELRRLEIGGVDNWEWYGESLNPEGEPDMDAIEKEIEEKVSKM